MLNRRDEASLSITLTVSQWRQVKSEIGEMPCGSAVVDLWETLDELDLGSEDNR